jgi:hypothetical protein
MRGWLHGRVALAAAVGATLVAVASPPVRAAGSRNLADAWLVSPAELGGGARPAWQVDVGTGRLFGLPELAQWRGEVQVARAGWHAGLAWERLGSGLLCEDGVRAQAGLGRGWVLGLEGGADRLVLVGDEPRLAPALAVRATGRLAPGLRLGVWVHLLAAPDWHGNTGLRRLALLTGGHREWGWAIAFDRAVDGRPSLQGEVLARVAPVACLGLRVDPWSGAVGLSTAWRVRVGWLRTSHLVHPELGTTHRWALVFAPGAGSEP